MTTIQISVTRIGSVDARLSVGGFVSGLPHRRRRLVLSVLVGFHSANGWSQVGMPAIGTNPLDTNGIGKMTALWMSSHMPMAVVAAAKTMVCAKMPGIRYSR